ncbi:kelch domain-containing protein 4-like [Elysia marginata]|uniref:Kelch domain-containing protein 4-like n=1 Tax=Elysia marginata TaxID=1093978 RepID=A0AAV4GIN1_9GAST|nr:kelch domain-containing protein 4-like [Elysia marginata]
MGKKNKKEKKGQGKAKTDHKAEKKAEKRSKKELAERGEEDIEKLIAEFQEKDKAKVQVIEEKCLPPSPRCNLSLVSNTEKEELLLFGGEYFTGNKMFVYNDLFAYQVRKNEWTKVSIPNAPPPRSAHQAVCVAHQGGQMWVFGGEFSSHSQNQFYHYKDLWLLQLRDKKWEQVKSPGGPSARSGHRMAALKKQLFVFGGFHDNARDYKYFNDLYSFDLETYTWAALTPSGTGPAPRSGCVLMPMQEAGKIIVYGGYSKEKVKRDVDKGTMHTDMFTLMQEKKREDAPESSAKWKWQPVKQSGVRPTPRSGMSGTVVAPGNRALLFGGVFDQEDDDEDLEGNFFSELWSLDLGKGKWFPVDLKGKKDIISEKKKRRKGKKTDEEGEMETDGNGDIEEDEGDDEGDEEMDIAQEGVESLDLSEGSKSVQETSDDIFKITVAPQTARSELASPSATEGTSLSAEEKFWPSARMNPSLVFKDGNLFMYGGIFEEGDKQVTLADLYKLDTHKMDTWTVIIGENRKLQEWQDPGSSDEEVEGAKASRKRHLEDDDNDDDEGKGKRIQSCIKP